MVRNPFSDSENEDSASAIEAQELLSIFKDNMEQNGGYLDDQMLVKVIMDKVISNPCKNQGFVLDGFPKTYEQAKELFHVDEHESDERTPISLYNKKIMPEFVLRLDASDSFLKDRVINLPEKLVQEHKYEQEHFLQILAKYREKNMEEESVVNYFEELDINPLLIDWRCGPGVCQLFSRESAFMPEGSSGNSGGRRGFLRLSLICPQLGLLRQGNTSRAKRLETLNRENLLGKEQN
ncbi:adenylate kinase 7-like [Phycodurus eques]|uniref:adenylate kinase 7-like n=1 Tax=Phycodurus eques TaxID=693459 RepID=UPI002ACD4D4D|nr:adenylate kinase 7-like [Phycodurus eques]